MHRSTVSLIAAHVISLGWQVSIAAPAVALEGGYTCEGLSATIVGTAGRDHISGTPGPDVIVALESRDRIRGGGGDDVICGGKGDDYVFGGAGDDRLLGQGNRAGPDDEHYGDHLDGGAGNDFMDGGDDVGTDWVTWESASAGVVIDRVAGTATGGSGNDTFVRLGGISGSSFDDRIIAGPSSTYAAGLDGDDVIESTGGYNYFWGGDGNDTVTGGPSEDYIYGGDGHDLLDAGEGFNRVRGEAGDDTLIGGASRDDLYGGPGHDDLDAGDGTDYYVNGEGGDDTLRGGGGNDQLDGGTGYDVGDGGDGTDSCLAIEEVAFCEAGPLTGPGADARPGPSEPSYVGLPPLRES